MKSHNKYEPLLVLLLSAAIYFIFFVLSAKEAIRAKTLGDVLLDFSLVLLITVLIWYGLDVIERLLDKKITWEKYSYKYILLQVVVITIYTSIVVYSIPQIYHDTVCEERGSESPIPMGLSIVLGVLIAFLVTSIHTGGDLFKKWKESLVDVEKYRKESVEAKYETLKNQVNPHFLFNSFSVLFSLISLDSDKAESFVDKLSKVYRYTLDNMIRN
ncbi:MAG: histidine kinase [Flavobacteriales bacterium]|nr:histidine kinase [Flavobacteriales bacterium]